MDEKFKGSKKGRRSSERKYSLQEEPRWRRERIRRVSTLPENDTIEEAHDEVSDDHSKNDDTKPYNLKKLISKNNAKTRSRDSSNFRRMSEYMVHAHLVQMSELKQTIGDAVEWRQTARWIKYEENLEEASGRWGRPHVASLCYDAVLNLRKCLQTAILLTDVLEKDMTEIAFRIAEEMASCELITETEKPAVMRYFLVRHKPVTGVETRFSVSWRKNSIYNNLQLLKSGEKQGGGRRSTMATLPGISIKSDDKTTRRYTGDNNLKEQRRLRKTESEPRSDQYIKEENVRIDVKDELFDSSPDTMTIPEDSILKRLPRGSEATLVLVGTMDYLAEPVLIFIRLTQSSLMPLFTEAPIPVKFIIVLLGPENQEVDYHEIGRSMSTLMSNPEFNQTAQKAKSKTDLLTGVDEFLDETIILPPGKWDNQDLFSFEELKNKATSLKQRKMNANIKKFSLTEVEKESIKDSIGVESIDEKSLKLIYLDPLERTGKPFGGLINDIKRKSLYYLSDFKDGLNGQCLAATIFIFFAALSSAITFGGLVANKTNNLIGIPETLISTALIGILFALISGQPMMIVGTTGPLLLFEESLYNLCLSNGISYLTLRVYVGFWLGIISIIIAFFEGSVLVRKFTRFTEEIFSTMISLIFIIEALSKVMSMYGRHPLISSYCVDPIGTSLEFFNYSFQSFDNSLDANMTEDVFDKHKLGNDSLFEDHSGKKTLDPQPNTALFSTFLAFGTFGIAYYLKLFKNSKYLGKHVRQKLGDFGVPISIVTMVILDYAMTGIFTEKLNVPEGLSPSSPEKRGWIIPLNGSSESEFPLWIIFGACIPALMVYIITFMETHIAELIVDKPERNLQKGSGFHLDIVVISILNIVCGLMGAPFVCVATVRSVAHVSALTVMSTTHAPGEKPFIVEIKEQRLTGLLVSFFVGVSVLMASLLKLIPMAVLYGIFLYMGISSMNGIELLDRICLMFRPVKYYPPYVYVKKVTTRRMHMFTLIQIGSLVLLWVIKSSRISLIFPFLLAMMIPLRYLLRYIFTQKELRALDGKQGDLEMDDET